MKIHGIEVSQKVHKDLPYIVDRYKNRSLVVMGCGKTLWDDVASIYGKHKGDYMGLGRVLLDYPDPLEHAAGNHSTELALFTFHRRYTFPMHPHMHTHSCRIEEPWAYEEHLIPQYLWDFPDYYKGSSGLTAVLAALCMGYEEIILAGMPMDDKGYYCSPFWVHPHRKLFMGDWERAAAECFQGKVKSLSGNTRELLGAPGEPKAYFVNPFSNMEMFYSLTQEERDDFFR